VAAFDAGLAADEGVAPGAGDVVDEDVVGAWAHAATSAAMAQPAIAEIERFIVMRVALSSHLPRSRQVDATTGGLVRHARGPAADAHAVAVLT